MTDRRIKKEAVNTNNTQHKLTADDRVEFPESEIKYQNTHTNCTQK